MSDLFKGFDHFRASDDLKKHTTDQILRGVRPQLSPVSRTRAAVAAVLAVALIGGSMATVFRYTKMTDKYSGVDPTGNTAVNGGYGDTEDGRFTADASPETDSKKEDGTVDDLPDLDREPTTDIAIEETAPGGTGGSDKKGDAVIKDAPTTGAPKPAASAPAGTASSGGNQNVQAGTLTAKEWNDNQHFDFWVNLMGQNKAFYSYQKNWGISLTRRTALTVTNGQTPVAGAKAVLLDTNGAVLWTAVTDNQGKAYLFSQAFGGKGTAAKLAVSYQGKKAEKALTSATTAVTVVLNDTKTMAPALDLMFVCDTTGSMGDELSYLQQELEDIIKRVKKDNGNIPLRLSVNFYRDEGDAYVVSSNPFVTNVDQAIAKLKEQSANGGGDFEEAVDKALEDALNNHQWSDSASAKLLFLVLDAPPHPDKTAQMQKILAKAAEMGVRIIPVAASGIDQNTEFILRALSVGTGGTYVTLTDDSGVGGSHLDPTIGDAPVYKLNELLVKIVNRYLK